MLIAYLVLSGTVLLNVLEVLPFAPWLLRLFRTVKSETLLASLANIGLFGWLTYRYLRLTARNSIQPELTKPRTQQE